MRQLTEVDKSKLPSNFYNSSFNRVGNKAAHALKGLKDKLGLMVAERESKEPEEDEGIIKAFPSTRKICKDPDCKKHGPNQHVHAMEECKGHVFCRADPVVQVSELYQDIPITSDYQINEVRKLLHRDTQSGGHHSPEKIKERYFKGGIFGQDEPIKTGRKLVATEESIDQWLAAHYGLTIDTMPPNKPPEMPK